MNASFSVCMLHEEQSVDGRTLQSYKVRMCDVFECCPAASEFVSARLCLNCQVSQPASALSNVHLLKCLLHIFQRLSLTLIIPIMSVSLQRFTTLPPMQPTLRVRQHISMLSEAMWAISIRKFDSGNRLPDRTF